MEVLQVLISDIPDPAFIINEQSRQILLANEEATTGAYSPVGKVVDDVVFIEEEHPDTPYTFFNNQWFDLNQESFIWKEQSYLKMVLKRRKSVPNPDTLQTLRNMTAVLLHQFRSPLTGVQGYMELMKEELKKESAKRLFDIWGRGINQLFTIMDELELLYNIPLSSNKHNMYSEDIKVIIGEILDGYPSKTRNLIRVKGNSNIPVKFNCNPACLKRVLSILIKNAIEHSSDENHEVIIAILDNQSIKISHKGKPIPEPIAKYLFYPFVTSKANNLGIGLTKALLYANQIGGAIFLTDNCAKSGISLTLRLPPSEEAANLSYQSGTR